MVRRDDPVERALDATASTYSTVRERRADSARRGREVLGAREYKFVVAGADELGFGGGRYAHLHIADCEF